MSDTVKIKCSMSVNYAIGTDYEVIDTSVPRSDWDAMTPDERRKVCQEMYEKWVWQKLDGGWEVEEWVWQKLDGGWDVIEDGGEES